MPVWFVRMTIWTGITYVENVGLHGAASTESHYSGTFRGSLAAAQERMRSIGIADFRQNYARRFGRPPDLRRMNVRFEAPIDTSELAPVVVDSLVITHRGKEHRGERVRRRLLPGEDDWE